MNDIRIKLLELSDLTQATILKIVSEKDIDCIRVSVHGYTEELDYIDFSYELGFPDEKTRDQAFEVINREQLFEDIKKVVSESRIPILI